MKFGACTAFENMEAAKKAGFSYIECALSQLAEMEEEAFLALAEKIKEAPVPVLCCNGFMPGTIKVTGPDWEEAKIRAYLDKALARASAIGVKTAVFGSGASRNVPQGWSYEKAWQQLAAFFKIAAEYAEKYDVRIAIEPLRRQECNIVNLVSEAVLLAAWVDSPCIGVLADTFHMLASGEPWEAMTNAGEKLWHVHISCPLADMSSRIYPQVSDGFDYREVLSVLTAMEYQGNVSVEAGTQDFEKEAEAAAACLKTAAGLNAAEE